MKAYVSKSKSFLSALLLITLYSDAGAFASLQNHETEVCPMLLEELNFININFQGYSIYNCDIVQQLKAHAMSSNVHTQYTLDENVHRILSANYLSHLSHIQQSKLQSIIVKFMADFDEKRRILDELYENRVMILPHESVQSSNSISKNLIYQAFPFCNITKQCLRDMLKGFRLSEATTGHTCQNLINPLRKFATKLRGVYYLTDPHHNYNNRIATFCESIKKRLGHLPFVANGCSSLKVTVQNYYKSLANYLLDKMNLLNYFKRYGYEAYAQQYANQLHVFENIDYV